MGLRIILATICTLLYGCYSPQGELPQPKLNSAARTFSQADVTAVVSREWVTVAAPLPLNMPEACQNLSYNHFHPTGASDFAEADKVLLLVPGMQAGANVLTYLAEQLVFTARQTRNANLHVITMERRNQCLVDNTGLKAAEQQQDVLVARDYYYDKRPVDGQVFQGFYRERDVPYLVEFGLARVLEDMLAVAQHALPDRQDRETKLYIGGHSLGGNLTSAFMGWDFDGDRSTVADAGFNQAAGFVRLDIGITPADPVLDGFLAYGSNGFTIDRDNETNKNYRFAVHQMQLGLLPRINRLPGATPETFMLIELVGMMAHWAPDEETTLLKTFPTGSGPNLLLRLIHSRDTLNFVTNNPSIFDFRYTNEALLGVILDDDFMPITILQGSMGFLADGPVEVKTFPINDTIKNLAATVDDFLGFLLTDTQLYTATDAGPDLEQLNQGPLYSWANYDEIGSSESPLYQTEQGTVLTEFREEMTDINDLARISYEGDTNFTEWYMPQRLSVDLGQIREAAVVEGLPFYHYAQARGSKLIEIVGNESIVNTSVAPLGELVIADGYNHVDILTAANNTPQHRENAVIAPLLEFLFR